MEVVVDAYKPEDFEQMLFNVMAIKEGDSILEAFPRLQQYPEFRMEVEGVDKDQLLRYICLLYDRKTPLTKNDNVVSRKMEAAQLAGFKWDEQGQLPFDTSEVMYGKSFEANHMIIRFARLQHNTKFSALITGTEAYYNKLVNILNARAGSSKGSAELEKIKGELWKQSREMEEDLSRLSLELLNEDNSPYLKAHLFSIIDREASQMLMLTPEKVAANGEEV